MEQRKYFTLTVLTAVVLVLLAQINAVTACSCMPQHAQTTFCKSDYGKWILSDEMQIISHVLTVINRVKREREYYVSVVSAKDRLIHKLAINKDALYFL